MKSSSKHFTQKSFYPWLAILLCAAFLFYKYILVVYPSIMTEELMRTFDIQRTGLGHLAATFFYVYLVTQLFVGIILDRFSVRYFSAFALLISALGALWFWAADTLTQAVLARGLMGFGAAFATVSYMKVASIWFRANQFAFVSGLLVTAAMIGAIVGQAPLAYLASIEGWRETIFISAMVGMVIAALFFLIVRDRPLGQTATTKKLKHKVSMKDVISVLTSRQNWLLTFHSGLTFAPVTGLGGLWGNAFLVEAYDLSLMQASFLTSFMFWGFAFGGPLLGLLSDRLGQRKNVMLVGNLLATVALIAAIYMQSLSPFWIGIFLFVFGFGASAFMLGFSVGRQINHLALAATVVAMINTGDALFEASVEPIIGILLDWQWAGEMVNGLRYLSPYEYRVAFAFMPVCLVVATLLIFFIKEPKTQAHKMRGGTGGLLVAREQ
jgi:MFS family permease